MLKYSVILVIMLLNINKAISLNLLTFDDINSITNFVNNIKTESKGGFHFNTILQYDEATQYSMIFNKMDELMGNLRQLPVQHDNRLHIDSLLKEINQDGIEKLLFEFKLNIKTIFGIYNSVRGFMKNPIGNKNPNRMKQFYADLFLLKNMYLKPALQKLYQVVTSQSETNRKNLLERFIDNINIHDARSHCSLDMPFDQKIYFIYSEIIRSELSAYLIIAYCNIISVVVNKNANDVREVNEALNQVASHSAQYMVIAKEALKKAPTEFELCAPLEAGKKYIELAGAIQEFLVNEADISPDQNCKGSCSDHTPDSVNGCYYSNEYCPQNPCRGGMYRCQDMGNTRFCELPKGSPKRYEWIDGNQGRYGQLGENCSGTIRTANQHVGAFTICSMCICSCVDESKDSNAIRTLSLIPQYSNITDNRVVTGVRFVEKDKIIQIQIKEGKLEPLGRIKNGSEHWIELEKITYSSATRTFYKKNKNNQIPLKENTDYFQIKKNQRSISLDDIMAHENYVVTGVKLSYTGIKTRSGRTEPGVELQAYVTPFNENNGKLIPHVGSPSHWINSQLLIPTTQPNKRPPLIRDELPLAQPLSTNPHFIAEVNLPDSQNHQFIKFTTSDIWQDIGQHTVPYFDARDVVFPKSSPILGIGLAHLGGPRSAGFLTLKIYDTDHYDELRSR